MKKAFAVSVLNIFCAGLMAQPSDFEGKLVYIVEVRSKEEGVEARIWKTILGFGDSVIVFVKKGNYRQTSGIRDTYFITKDEKAYYRFKGIDTLFYMDYSSDTIGVSAVSKKDERKNIAGQECKSITIKTGSTNRKYFYAPTLYMNPEYDKNNKLGGYDVFARETSSLYLGLEEEDDSYSYSQTCRLVKPGPVDEAIFELPKLPVKMFSVESLLTPAKFAGSSNRWLNYLQSNLNGELGAKYVKIPKGEPTAVEIVIVTFMVNEKGRVTIARVSNKQDVHPKLAEEAVRVILSSPPWVPATIYGEKTVYWMKQPVTFSVSRK